MFCFSFSEGMFFFFQSSFSSNFSSGDHWLLPRFEGRRRFINLRSQGEGGERQRGESGVKELDISGFKSFSGFACVLSVFCGGF